MKTNPVIDGIKVMGVILEEDVTALAVGVVAEQVEKHDRFKELPVFIAEVEVVIFGIIVDVLLQGASPVGTIITERGERNDTEAKRLTEEIGSNFAPCQRVLGEIPERLFAA